MIGVMIVMWCASDNGHSLYRASGSDSRGGYGEGRVTTVVTVVVVCLLAK